MRDCDLMRDELKAYVDRELSPLRRLAVARHLASCAACRAEAKEMALTTEEIRRDEVTEVDPALRERFISEVAAAAPSPPRKPPVRLRNWAIAGVVLVAFGVFSMQSQRQVHTASLVGHMLSVHAPRSSTPPVKFDEPSSNSNTMGGFATNAPSTMGNADGKDSAKSGPQAVFASPVTAGGVGGYPDADENVVAKVIKVPVLPTVRALKPEQITTILGKTATGGDDEDLGRKVHKSANLTLQVADPEARSEQIESMVKAAGGFVTSSSLNTGQDGIKTAELTVNVPLPQFEDSLAQFAKLGSVQAKNVTGEDITQKVSDAGQRENVLEQDMAEAQAQLKKKGSKAGWDLQEDARDLRIQLAQSRARLRILKSLGELSEIDITLSQPAKSAPPVQTGFVADMGANGRGALESALGAIETLVAFVLWILAYAPLWIPAFLIGRWGWKKYQKTMETAA